MEPAVRGANLVRAVEGVAVTVEVHTRLIGAGKDKDREPGGDPFDDVDLPVSENGVGDIVPVAAELLAMPKRQVVNNARRKAVVQVDLGKRPVELAPIWQRE